VGRATLVPRTSRVDPREASARGCTARHPSELLPPPDGRMVDSSKPRSYEMLFYWSVRALRVRGLTKHGWAEKRRYRA
jgi:hypothetical protein